MNLPLSLHLKKVATKMFKIMYVNHFSLPHSPSDNTAIETKKIFKSGNWSGAL